MLYSKAQISSWYGASVKTLGRRLKELEEEGKFKKESLGKYFDEKEVMKLSEILNFTIKTGKAA